MAAEGDVPIAAAAEGDVAVGDEIAVAAAAAEKEDVAVGDEIAVEAEKEEDVAVGAEEEDVAVGAEEEQQVPVEIWSLRMGLVHTVKLLGNPTMKVCAVNLSHAAALQAVLSRKKARAIIGLELLGPISYVDRLLTLGIDALLPNVADEDRSVASLRALSVWSWDIEEAAAGIPGNLFHDLRQVGVRVRMVVAAALNGNPAEEWLKQRLQEVIASLTAMRNSPVYLTQTDEEEEEGNYYVEDEENIMEEVQVAEVVLDTLEIFSLEDGAEFAAEVVGKAVVRIWGVEMRHATALELLLTNQVADKGWDVPELEQLRYIARFDLLLTLGLNAHVPVVGGNMSTTSYLCAFKTWSWEAQWVARAALREEHFEKVKQLMQKVRRWVSAAHKGRSPVLITNLQQIRASLRELKTGYVYL
jgi:hypothetical protein